MLSLKAMLHKAIFAATCNAISAQNHVMYIEMYVLKYSTVNMPRVSLFQYFHSIIIALKVAANIASCNISLSILLSILILKMSLFK